MKTKITIFTTSILFLLNSCRNNDIQIGENTFIHDHKIYKLIDNELREIADLNAPEIKKFGVSKPTQRDLGVRAIGYIKKGASTTLKALYRGNFLYYSLRIDDLNDLRENYYDGVLTIDFVDEFGFILHSTNINAHELTGELGDDGKISSMIYKGKTEMSTEINAAISGYEITSNIKSKFASY